MGADWGVFSVRRCAARWAWIFVGLTAAEQARAVDLAGLEEYCRDRQAAGMPELYWRAVTNPPGAFDPGVVNGDAWRAAEVPAVNEHGTARGAAGLYAALLQGKLVSAALLGEATAAQCSGMDAVFGQDAAWGLGFGVDTDGFGMGGSGGSYAGASTLGGYAFAFVTATMGSHARATAVENAFRGCIGVPPLDDLAGHHPGDPDTEGPAGGGTGLGRANRSQWSEGAERPSLRERKARLAVNEAGVSEPAAVTVCCVLRAAWLRGRHRGWCQSGTGCTVKPASTMLPRSRSRSGSLSWHSASPPS